MDMFCDNQATVYIASSSMYQGRIKHIEIDYQFIQEVVMKGEVVHHIKFVDQIEDLFTK